MTPTVRMWIWRVVGAVVALLFAAFCVRSFGAIEDRNAQREQTRTVLVQVNRLLTQLDGCTVPSPVPPPLTGPDTRRPADVHPCYERGTAQTADAINQLRHSVNCVGLFVLREVPEPCADVIGRLTQLEAGVDPFATTTTTTKGNP